MAYSAALPLLKDPNDGFVMLKKLEDLAKQNLKMVLYTEPGERVIDSNFGVGIKKYLFEKIGTCFIRYRMFVFQI